MRKINTVTEKINLFHAFDFSIKNVGYNITLIVKLDDY